MASLLLAQMPDGLCWPRETGATLPRLMTGLAVSASVIASRARDLLREAPYDAPLELLGEWELTLGLPDPCAGSQPSVIQRQTSVRAALASSGGASVPYLIGVAAALGYTITIDEFTPLRFGMPFGRPFGGEPWASIFRVRATALPGSGFKFGANRFGEAFGRYGNLTLQCTIDRIKPAHTAVQYAFV